MSATALHNQISREAPTELIDALRRHAEPLPPPERADEFGAFFDRFGDARVVLLGEATHGTSEFYRARAAITRRLIVHHGFNIVAVEADWPDAARIDDYVRHQARRPRRGDVFVRFPTWMWRNVEVLEFADWLRGHNAALSEDRRASVHGLDVYSLSESIHAAKADHFAKTIRISGKNLTQEQRDKLIAIAARCPVQRTLEGTPVITTNSVS